MLILSKLKNSPEDFSSLFSTPPIILQTDWFNQPLSFKIEYYLASSREKLFFGAKVFNKNRWKFDYKQNDFKEGLWERDVIELFLSEVGQENYLELNIDPNAAFWAKEFSAYRKEAKEHKKPNSIRTICANTAQYWQVGLSLDLTELPFATKALEDLELNICGIFGQNQRYYLAYHSLPQEKPDFHRRDLIKK